MRHVFFNILTTKWHSFCCNDGNIDLEIKMEIKQAQEEVDCWIKQYGVRYFNELTNMAILTEEVGEVARIMSRRFGEQSTKNDEQLNLDDELADVLFVLICIANQTGIDLQDAFVKNIRKKTQRDSTRHVNNDKL